VAKELGKPRLPPIVIRDCQAALDEGRHPQNRAPLVERVEMPDQLSAERHALFQDILATRDRAGVEGFMADITTADLASGKWVELAVRSKEAGFADIAEKMLLRALDADGKDPAAHYELAVICRLSDRKHQAIAHLLRAKSIVPGHFRIRLLLAHMLYAIGAHPEAEDVCRDTVPGSPKEDEELGVLREFGTYLQEFPHGRARYLVDEAKRRFRYIDAVQVAGAIQSAIQDRRPFSLVRLGDGEGAFAKIDAEDEARYARLYASHRREWCRLLYGADFDPAFTGYAAVVDTLMSVAGEADIVGIPYRSWVDHEYAISSVRGVPCLMNIHRSFLQSPDGVAPTFCTQNIHTELHRQGLIEPLLRMTTDIGLISCFSDLPARVKSHFALDNVELFKIPGERYSRSLLSTEALAGVHFPFVYWDIVRRLSEPHNGRVFLIAAGTLAKFYAAVIKRNGGIALDIGSLVDGWMNIASRPGYDAKLAL
jgi:hypothetical protein